MTVTQNIFLAWGLFCGGAALILASPTLAVIRYANKVAGDRRPELLLRHIERPELLQTDSVTALLTLCLEGARPGH
jgi:hypothetical protein